ncbi:hypothetical protein FOQG_18190 [Fusarium oxysporum f. sp. raphani 54005]|uniref:Uncharacterized protein n=2 Tax=Fusarium oxysporum TaxID=5507 RepID=X0C2S7_FUSOX|nr:hypothetical protein FOQG_18190 [Fusarium oxysporum f. sp. raphani 54005]EXL64699.1 hypothetical protein FOPG_19046 [Fusarium oxysporum f. sp. conglutinans race 2 54008]
MVEQLPIHKVFQQVFHACHHLPKPSMSITSFAAQPCVLIVCRYNGSIICLISANSLQSFPFNMSASGSLFSASGWTKDALMSPCLTNARKIMR